MRRSFVRTGLAFAYVTALLLVRLGAPLWASAAGAGIVTAATGLGRPLPMGTLAVGAVSAAVGGAAVFGILRFVLAPAYPEVRAVAEANLTPLAITLAFGILARWDLRKPTP